MTVRWSRIHAQLGEAPGDLTFGMVESACAAKMAETDDLDWKKTLPCSDEPCLQEFAKDVAAMANTTGGLLVYGVREDKGGKAEEIVSVDGSEKEQRRLRQLAASRIRPLVAGLDLLPLTSDDGTKTVLVLSVPRSPDAPHVVARDGGEGKDGWLGMPFRSGPETQWMRERELERAYRDRFSRQDDERAKLASLLTEVDDRLDPAMAPWLIGAARPRTPLPGLVLPPSVQDVQRVFESVLNRSIEVLEKSTLRFLLVNELGPAALSPRTGLRRWIAQTLASIDSNDLANCVHIELHHDGSVTFAVALGAVKASGLDDFDHVYQPLVESFAVEFVALTETYARELGAQAPMSFQIDTHQSDTSSKPLVLINNRVFPTGIAPGPQRVLGSVTRRTLRSVSGEIPVGADVETLRGVAREIAQDVINQFGIPRLGLLG